MLDSIIAPLVFALPLASSVLFVSVSALLLLGGGAFAVWMLWDTNKPLGFGVGLAALIHLLLLSHFHFSQQGDPNGDLQAPQGLWRNEQSREPRELSWVFEPMRPGDVDPFPIHPVEPENADADRLVSPPTVALQPSMNASRESNQQKAERRSSPEQEASLEESGKPSEPSKSAAAGRLSNRFSAVDLLGNRVEQGESWPLDPLAALPVDWWGIPQSEASGSMSELESPTSGGNADRKVVDNSNDSSEPPSLDELATNQEPAGRDEPLDWVPPAANTTISRQHLEVAKRFGGDDRTQLAVDRGLDWLASHQEPGGLWDASRFGAGQETTTLGEHRDGTGRDADTGISGLALLAFLGAGYHHQQEQPYAEVIRKGLFALIDQQMNSGDLSGRDQIGQQRSHYFARMYCHGIASLALCEAYAATGDPKLYPAVLRAVSYTQNAQNRHSGGWRYHVRDEDDPGDMSQFGWQAMLLQSAMRAGVPVPAIHQSLMHKFLDGVTSQPGSGLACYRPRIVPGQSPSYAMTAEALACRRLLGFPYPPTAHQEAIDFLTASPPTSQSVNLYAWYYTSLALVEEGDDKWERWNDAMKSQLLTRQFTSGPKRGAWPNDCPWSGYGGTVYSTALSCLCLEVYYRHLPLLKRPQAAGFPSSPPPSFR
ncbi:MAG: prenyltransferase/squalene oxidase repeat-containing protein [Pirellulaceae bacterium]